MSWAIMPTQAVGICYLLGVKNDSIERYTGKGGEADKVTNVSIADKVTNVSIYIGMNAARNIREMIKDKAYELWAAATGIYEWDMSQVLKDILGGREGEEDREVEEYRELAQAAQELDKRIKADERRRLDREWEEITRDTRKAAIVLIVGGLKSLAALSLESVGGLDKAGEEEVEKFTERMASIPVIIREVIPEMGLEEFLEVVDLTCRFGIGNTENFKFMSEREVPPGIPGNIKRDLEEMMEKRGKGEEEGGGGNK